MRTKTENMDIIRDTGIIAIVRIDTEFEIEPLFEAVRDGGIKVIEITMNTPNAIKMIETVTKKFSDDMVIGVGTVLNSKTAKIAILSGAEFIVTPILRKDVITMCGKHSKIVIPGAFSPTEILDAWEYGADMVKVFPAGSLGSGYIKTIRGPLPQIKFVPTGGININNAGEFIKVGSTALGIGDSLINKKIVKEKRFDEIRELSAKFIKVVKEARV